MADEVICGFGKMFGCETYGIKLDAMVISKQITSSYFPLSAIIMNDRMFEPIADEQQDRRVTASPRVAIRSAR